MNAKLLKAKLALQSSKTKFDIAWTIENNYILWHDLLGYVSTPLWTIYNDCVKSSNEFKEIKKSLLLRIAILETI